MAAPADVGKLRFAPHPSRPRSPHPGVEWTLSAGLCERKSRIVERRLNRWDVARYSGCAPIMRRAHHAGACPACGKTGHGHRQATRQATATVKPPGKPRPPSSHPASHGHRQATRQATVSGSSLRPPLCRRAPPRRGAGSEPATAGRAEARRGEASRPDYGAGSPLPPYSYLPPVTPRRSDFASKSHPELVPQRPRRRLAGVKRAQQSRPAPFSRPWRGWAAPRAVPS